MSQSILATGSAFELFTGVIAIVLAALGLAGVYPLYMASIAMIAVGFALLAQGGTIATRWREAVHIAGTETRDRVGFGTEMIGGLGAIVLGALAFAHVRPLILLPAGAIVIGTALLLGGPAQPDLAEAAPATTPRRWHVTRNAVRTSSGVMVMAGLAAIVLAVIALAGPGPTVALTAVALVCTAAALVLAGGSIAARFTRRFA